MLQRDIEQRFGATSDNGDMVSAGGRSSRSRTLTRAQTPNTTLKGYSARFDCF